MSKSSAPDIQKMLVEVFIADAQKISAAIQQSLQESDIAAITSSAHAIKSALGNVGQADLAQRALDLEKAGLRGDWDYVRAHAPKLAEALLLLCNQFTHWLSIHSQPAKPAHTVPRSAMQRYLREIVAACNDFDDSAAYGALDLLEAMGTDAETAASIKKIRNLIYLHSDFDSAGELARGLMG